MPSPQPEQPLVTVHLVILRQAVCHSCGWESALTDDDTEAQGLADSHRCGEGV